MVAKKGKKIQNAQPVLTNFIFVVDDFVGAAVQNKFLLTTTITL